MSASWHEEDEEVRGPEAKAGFRSKPRFTFNEVRVLLEAVKRNRYIVLKKFNRRVSAETKKQTWADITNQVNSLGENHREVRQIMKKWADLKCDGKRRIVALRGPNGSSMRKKKLGPVEKMVHKILMMNPRGEGDSDADVGGDGVFRKTKLFNNPPPYAYLSLTDSSHSLPSGASVDLSPLSSPDKELAGHSSSDVDLGEDEGLDGKVEPSSLDPLPDDALMRMKPVHTYSRSSIQNQNPSSSRPAAVIPPTSSSSLAPPTSAAVADSSLASSSVVSSTSSAASTTSAAVNARGPASSVVPPPPAAAGSFQRRPQDHVAQLASQSLQQQRTSRALLASVSQSLEVLAQSVQLLVETQQEFVQESLLLQRETVDILKDFSNTTLTMLRDKATGGQQQQHHHHQPSHF